MKRHQLTVAFVRSTTEPGRYHDGYGLYLNVRPYQQDGNPGARSWVQRLVIQGRRRDIGLGSLDRVSLAQARKAAFENRNVARAGGDPTRKAVAVPTFAEALDIVIGIHRQGWKNAGKSEAQWRASMTAYALPMIGRMTVDAIQTADVMRVLLPHWQAKHETMRRVRQRISATMKWAIAQGYRQDDPAGDAIRAALPRPGAVKAHQRAIPFAEVAAALAAVKASGCYPVTALCMEILTLTACRSGEARLATWAEVDMDAAVWTIPAGRMKQKREHRVPLSDRALAILREAEQYRDTSGLIFPSVTGRALSDNTLSKLLRELAIDGTPHGFRSSFRDWAAEKSGLPEIVAEHALAHVNSDKTEASYRRTDMFDARRDLMARWADYLAGQSGKVVKLHG